MENKKPYYVLFQHYYGFPTGEGYQNVFSDYDLESLKSEISYLRGESEYPLYILTIDADANHSDAMHSADDFFQLLCPSSMPKFSPKKKELFLNHDSKNEAIGARLNRVRYGRVYS